MEGGGGATDTCLMVDLTHVIVNAKSIFSQDLSSETREAKLMMRPSPGKLFGRWRGLPTKEGGKLHRLFRDCRLKEN